MTDMQSTQLETTQRELADAMEELANWRNGNIRLSNVKAWREERDGKPGGGGGPGIESRRPSIGKDPFFGAKPGGGGGPVIESRRPSIGKDPFFGTTSRRGSMDMGASADAASVPMRVRRGGHARLGRPLGVEEEAVAIKIQHGNFEEPRDR